MNQRYQDDTPHTGSVLAREVEHAVGLKLDRTYNASGLHLGALVSELGRQRDAVEFQAQSASDANKQLNEIRLKKDALAEKLSALREIIDGIVDEDDALRAVNDMRAMLVRDPAAQPATLPLEIAGSLLPDDYVSPRLAAQAYRENGPKGVPVDDLIEKVVEYGDGRENEGGAYATFQKSEARRYRADADEVLSEIRAMLAATKEC